MNIAFLIPILLECPERERNLLDQLNYLLSLDATIYLFESDTTQKVPDLIGDLAHRIQYRFIQSEVFHRTRLLNQMSIAAAEFPMIALHDVDVFLDKRQYDEGNDNILNGSLDFCYPYTVWRWIARYTGYPTPDLGEELRVSLGGTILCNRSSFMAAGMENENCISWGMEDIERFSRWTTLGYKIGRIEGDLSHAEHPRDHNSGITNPYYEQNKQEAEKIRAMNQPELESYISTWSWINY